jgi:hypothetical protein
MAEEDEVQWLGPNGERLRQVHEFGYMVWGTIWGELTIWRVRILGPAGVMRGGGRKKGIRYKFDDLIWAQEAQDNKESRVGRVFITAEDNIGSLQDACCRLAELRDRARSEILHWRTRLHEEIREKQEKIEKATKRIAELDAFVPSAVVPGASLLPWTRPYSK